MTLACPLCAAPVREPPLERHLRYTLYPCSACGVRFWDPMQNPGAEWYEADGLYVLRDHDVEHELAWPQHQLLRDAPSRGGRLLDLGCGTGAFCAAARDAGYLVSGLDFNARAIEAGRTRFGLDDLHPLTLAEYRTRFPERRFDVVTLFEVLEHLEQPGQLLDAVGECLTARGHVALSVPNPRRLKGNEEYDLPPHHFTRWPRDALRAALERRGFEVLALREEPLTPRQVGRVLGTVVRLGLGRRLLARARAAASDREARQVAGRASRLYRLKETALTGVGAVTAPLLRAGGMKGSSLYALARKGS